MRKVVILAVALAAAAPASGQTGPGSVPPPYSTGDQWPTASDCWHYAVQAPAGAGRTRYAYVDAVPDGHAGWTVTVACGEHLTASGRETSRHVAKGTAGRGRMPGIGGEARVPGVPSGFSFIIDQPVGSEALDLASRFTDSRCASGTGQLSPGD